MVACRFWEPEAVGSTPTFLNEVYQMTRVFRAGGLRSAFSVILASSPIVAVFSLVLVFCFTSARRIQANREFRGLVFLRVYVGAIAVLFLFVVRRLNVQPSKRDPLPLFRLFRGTFWVLRRANREGPRQLEDPYRSWTSVLDRRNDREVLGHVRYTHYRVLFLTAGRVLLTSRVGAVALVRSASTGVPVRRQQVHQQISRDAQRAILRVS
jgi:NADH:ubiquinone oxidoreductase subunit 6 (subunit J)